MNTEPDRTLSGLRAVRPTPDRLDDVLAYAIEAGIRVTFAPRGQDTHLGHLLRLEAEAELLDGTNDRLSLNRQLLDDDLGYVRLHTIRAIIDLEDAARNRAAVIIPPRPGDDL